MPTSMLYLLNHRYLLLIY